MPTDPGHKDTWGSSKKYAEAFERYEARKIAKIDQVLLDDLITTDKPELDTRWNPWVDHGGEA